mgnify:CR=1 FL=1
MLCLVTKCEQNFYQFLLTEVMSNPGLPYTADVTQDLFIECLEFDIRKWGYLIKTEILSYSI